MIQHVKPMLKLATVCLFSLSTMQFAMAASEASQPSSLHYSQNDFTKVISVSQLKNITNQSYVVLEGYITGPATQTGKDNFIFQDNSGEIIVAIDTHVWHKQTVTPSTKIRAIVAVTTNEATQSTIVEAKYLDIEK